MLEIFKYFRNRNEKFYKSCKLLQYFWKVLTIRNKSEKFCKNL